MSIVHLNSQAEHIESPRSFRSGVNIDLALIQSRMKEDSETCHFIIKIPLKDYRLLGAFYVQKEKHARLMDQHGILRRDELVGNLSLLILPEKGQNEVLITQSPRTNEYFIYNKVTQQIDLYDLQTNRKTKSYAFPLQPNQTIGIEQPSNIHLLSIFNPNYLVINVTTWDAPQPMASAVETENLWSLNLETGEVRKITTYLDQRKARVEAEKIEMIAKLEAEKQKIINADKAKFLELEAELRRAFPINDYLEKLIYFAAKMKEISSTNEFSSNPKLIEYKALFLNCIYRLEISIRYIQNITEGTEKDQKANITEANDSNIRFYSVTSGIHLIAEIESRLEYISYKLRDNMVMSEQALHVSDEAGLLQEKILRLSEPFTQYKLYNRAAYDRAASDLNDQITNIKANYGKKLGKERYCLATYSHEINHPMNEVIYYFKDYELDDTTKNVTGDPITRVCAYNLLSGETKTLTHLSKRIKSLYVNKDLKVSMFHSYRGRKFKAYKVDDMGKPELKFLLSSADRNSVTPQLFDENHVILLDARVTDKKTPVLISLVNNSQLPLLPEKEVKKLKSDVKKVILHPTTKELISYETDYDKRCLHLKTAEGSFESYTLDVLKDRQQTTTLLDALKGLKKAFGSDKPGFELNSFTRTINYLWHTDPHTQEPTLKPVSSQKISDGLSRLTESKFSTPTSFTFKARDGLEIQAYLTLPKSVEKHENLPTVLLIHGGPMARDRLTFDHEVQFWASRGCAVVQINYRGSKGFGEKFVKSSFGEWNGKMIDDLIDGLDHLIKLKILDKGRIIATGTSYGAFATASLLTKYPDYFQCGIATNGFYDLVEHFKASMEKRNIHHPEHKSIQFGADLRLKDQYEREEAKLKIQSPVNYIHNMTKPLLLITGSADNNCLPSSSADFAKEAKKFGKSVTHIEFKGEGHTFTPENEPHLMGLQENFVARYVPGIYAEPMDREMKQNPVIQVKTTSNY